MQKNSTKDIDPSSVTFDNYLKTFNANQPEHNLTVNELKDAFFSLKLNKSPGYDEISFNVIKTCFGSLHKPLLHIFNQSLQGGIFPDKLKIARFTPSFKKGSEGLIIVIVIFIYIVKYEWFFMTFYAIM